MSKLNRSFPLDLLSEGSKSTTFEKAKLDSIIKDIENKITSTINKRKSCGGIEKITTTVSKYHICVEIIVKNEVRPAMYQIARMFIPDVLSSYGDVTAMIIKPYEDRTIAVSMIRPDIQPITLKEILESKEFQDSEALLPIALGIDTEDNKVVVDLASMPHLLVSGDIGQGKFTLINNIILSLLYRFSPTDLQFVLIEPGYAGLNIYNRVKNQYLLPTSENTPEVITEEDQVPTILNSLFFEMLNRRELLRTSGCRNIQEYNLKLEEGTPSAGQHHLPYIIVVIDEFRELIQTYGGEFESPLEKLLLQSMYSLGIHIIITTMGSSIDIITDSIKARFQARIAFKVSSEEESKATIDTTEAKNLIGQGDMLFEYGGSIKRIQGCFTDSAEVEKICDWIAKEIPEETSYFLPIVPPLNIDDSDPLFLDAARMIIDANRKKLEAQKKKSPFSFKHLINLLGFRNKTEDN